MSVPHNENAQFFFVNPTMSDGGPMAQLPDSGTTLNSDNPNVVAGIFNAGTRQCYAKRLVPGPQVANIAIAVNGVSAPSHPVLFDGPPPVTVASVAVVNYGTGNL